MSKKNTFDLYFGFKTTGVLYVISLLLGLFLPIIYKQLELYVGSLVLVSSLIIVLLVLYILSLMFSSGIKLNIFNSTYIVIPFLYLLIVIYSSENKTIFELGEITSKIIIFLLTTSFILFHIYIASKLKNTKKIKLSFLITILFLVLAITIGTLFIANFTQNEKHELKLFLNDCQTKERFHNAELECQNLLGIVVENSLVKCEIKNQAIIVNNGTFLFTHLNGSYSTQNFTEEINFIVPENVGRVDFTVNGFQENTSVCLSTANSQTFANESEYKENKKDFILYFISLLGFIALTFPIIVKEWKNFLKI